MIDQLFHHWRLDWEAPCKIRLYMILQIIINPAVHLWKVLRCLVLPKDVCRCIDGMNLMLFSRNLGMISSVYCLNLFNSGLYFLRVEPFLLNCTCCVQLRAKIIFGLNALTGRTIRPDGSAQGAWDYTNSESLIRYTVEKNYMIHGWELGKSTLQLQNSIKCSYYLYGSIEISALGNNTCIFAGQGMNWVEVELELELQKISMLLIQLLYKI